MAELAVEFVLKNLADLIVKEAQFLGGVGEKVERVQLELTRIKCCLKDANSKCKGDKRVQNWLNELRDVAYHITDATDTFLLKVEDHRQKDASSFFQKEACSFFQKLKKVYKKPMKLSNLHKLGTELNNFENLLKNIYENMLHCGIRDLQLEDKSKGEAVSMPSRRAAYSEVDNTEIVGLQEDQYKILKLLTDWKIFRRAVITIVGAGGLGKTTLACMVYRSGREHFDYHMMLSVSQQFSLTDLLRRMLCQLTYSVPENEDVGYLISKIKSFLRDRRYLIILDDVWGVDLWSQLKNVLPDSNNGSRILMTSRSIDVAKSADSEMAPYELNFLDDKKSLDLLLKRALPYRKPDNVYPSNFLKLAYELSKKCNGIPLALIVLGDKLSTKHENYLSWERVLRTWNWHSDGKDCMDVLAMSYEHMPYYLKACFLYLASFPRDYKISATRLVRMWVAEGFLRHERGKTMEEQADNCLEELFQRSMVQVSSRCMNGSIKCFHVHDLFHDLAIHEAEQEKFVTVFSQESCVNNPHREIRHASLHYCSQQFREYVDPITRSLLLFGSPLHLPIYTNCRLLRVLELVDVRNDIHELRGFEKLIHLKYLGFRNCHVGIFSCSFRGMKSLETLDVRGTRAELPNALWTIGTLRHVLCDDNSTAGQTLDGPISTAVLRNLQTIQWVSPLRTWDTDFPHLNNLRKLGVHNFFDQWVTVINLLQTLPSLVSLGIKGTSLPMDIIYPKALPIYQNLKSLYLDGKCSENVTIEASLFPPHLVKLTLVGSRLEQNPMSELGKLESLKKLCLRENVTNYSSPTICPVGFPVLQYLEVGDSSIKDLTVEKGVMPQLTHLRVCDNIVLNLPPDLMHVTITFVKNRLVPKLANELSEVQSEVEEISENRINTDETEAVGLQNIGREIATMPLQSPTYQEVDETKVLDRQEIVEEADTMHVQRAAYQEVDEIEVIRLQNTVGEAATMPLRRATSQEVDEIEVLGRQNIVTEAVTMPLQSPTYQEVDETKVLDRQEIVEEADTMHVQRATYQEVDEIEVIRLQNTVGEAATMPLRRATSQEVDEIEVLGRQNIVTEAVTMPLQSPTYQEEDETEVPGQQEIVGGAITMHVQRAIYQEVDEIQVVGLQNIVGEADTMQLRRAIDQEVDESEVVGLQDDKNNILMLLHTKETRRRVVITIVGIGGLGKTTLARMVYQSGKADFKYHIVLSISRHFRLIDILRKMIQKYKPSVPVNRDENYYVGMLKKILRRKRYLIILDDVWRVDLWDQLRDVLPDVKNGSRILMTSRFVNVAKSSDPDMEPYELHHLNDRDSLDLLLKKAIPSQDPSEECHSDLLELADELLKKCKGLPVALIVVGGILSTKRGSYPMWEKVLRTMDWHSDGKACMQVLQMSYEDMPNYLKECFKYLAVFPKDYEICANRLIRMLVAEEFLPQEGDKSKEEKAQECLEELFERSMVQVSSRCMNGLIKSFHVHDLLHDLAVHEARQENFVMVFSQATNVNQPNRESRRASLSYTPLSLKYLDPNTCFSLLFFGVGLKFTEFYNFRLLRVLELVGVRNNTHDLKGFEELTLLKYLGFRNCHIGIFSCSFHSMNSLETLDVRGTRAELSNDLWKIGTLRHVLCDDDPIAGPTLDGPISTAELTNLQTMQWISPPKEWAEKLPILENLCKLGVCNFFDDRDWVTVTNLLPTLCSLVSLRIKGISLPMDIVFSCLPMNLQSLYIEGNWRAPLTLKAGLFPEDLIKLTLIESRLQQNPMPELGKLKSLKKLCLREHVRNYSGPTICQEGFPVLQYLEVTDYDIKDLTVAQGVMPKLTYLKVHDDIQFKRSSELEHVTVVIR